LSMIVQQAVEQYLDREEKAAKTK